MSAKHTPGPWQVNSRDPLQICDCDGEVRGCSPIAHVVQTGEPAPRREDIANARLIAAAPELLEALETLVALDDGDNVGLWDHTTEFDAARAAIAKATGEAA